MIHDGLKSRTQVVRNTSTRTRTQKCKYFNFNLATVSNGYHMLVQELLVITFVQLLRSFHRDVLSGCQVQIQRAEE